MILSSQSILKRRGMIKPFVERGVQNGMSYGLSSSGYDIRCKQDIILPSHAFTLASSIEHFNMPIDLQGRPCDKSTWARQGLQVYNTVIEPGWHGYLTLELFNNGPRTLVIHAGDPIAQVVFQLLDEPTNMPYKGKYQGQDDEPTKALFESYGVPGWATRNDVS